MCKHDEAVRQREKFLQHVQAAPPPDKGPREARAGDAARLRAAPQDSMHFVPPYPAARPAATNGSNS